MRPIGVRYHGVDSGVAHTRVEVVDLPELPRIHKDGKMDHLLVVCNGRKNKLVSALHHHTQQPRAATFVFLEPPDVISSVRDDILLRFRLPAEGDGAAMGASSFFDPAAGICGARRRYVVGDWRGIGKQVPRHENICLPTHFLQPSSKCKECPV